MGGLDQVTVVLPGEALASAEPGVRTGPVDQPGASAGFIAGQGGAGKPSAGASPHAYDWSVAAAGPSADGRRRHREAGLVLEDEPDIERRPGPSTCGQVSFTQPATAASSRSTARRAGPWQLQPCRLSTAATPCTV